MSGRATRSKRQYIYDLDTNFQRSNDANHVFICHNDYDDAVRAMNTLAADIKKYQNFIGSRNKSDKTEKEILEDTEKEAKALRESAEETTRKLEAYLERRGKEGSLNEKGQKRVKAFKKVLKTTKSINYICDDRIIESDTRMIAIDNAEMLEKDIKAENSKISAYQVAADNESLSDAEKMAVQFAAFSAQNLKDFAFGNHELNEEEMNLAKDAIASIIIFENKLFHPNSNPTIDEYDKQVSELANDPAFSRAVDLSTVSIRNFITSKDITKEVSEVYSQFSKNNGLKEEAVNQEIVNEKSLILIDEEAVKEEPAVKEEELKAEKDIQAHANESKEFTKAVASDRETI